MPAAKSVNAPRAATPRLEIWFACPNCGAPSHADDDQSSISCTHCGSLLFLVRDDAPVIGMSDCVVRTEEDLARIFIGRRLAEYRADKCTEASGGGDASSDLARGFGQALGGVVGGSVGGAIGGALVAGLMGSSGGAGGGAVVSEPLFLRQLMAAEEKRLAGIVRVGERRLLHVPYWQIRAIVLRQVLARTKNGSKIVAVRSQAAEQSSPAYDGTKWNLRDRGLRLGTARMRLLTPRDVNGDDVFLAVRSGSEAERGDLERVSRLPPPDLDRLHGRGDLVHERRFLVYRPLWLVQFLESGRESWLLIEGQTGIVGGEITDAHELHALLAERGADPLGAMRPTRVTLAPSRCVECGQDLGHEPGPWLRACPHCRTGLATGRDGLERVGYDHAPTADGAAWLPCWSFRVAIRLKSGRLLVALDELGGIVGMPAGSRSPAGSRLYVPAVRLLGSSRGEKAFDDLCEWLHRSGIVPRPGAIAADLGGPSLGCDLREPDARELARTTLLALFDATMAARINVPMARELFDETEILLAEPRLVMVSVPARLVPSGG